MYNVTVTWVMKNIATSDGISHLCLLRKFKTLATNWYVDCGKENQFHPNNGFSSLQHLRQNFILTEPQSQAKFQNRCLLFVNPLITTASFVLVCVFSFFSTVLQKVWLAVNNGGRVFSNPRMYSLTHYSSIWWPRKQLRRLKSHKIKALDTSGVSGNINLGAQLWIQQTQPRCSSNLLKPLSSIYSPLFQCWRQN